MKRIIVLVAVALVMALMIAMAGPASAISGNAAPRACVGAFFTGAATAAPGLGLGVKEEATDPALRPIGSTDVAPAATSCPEE